ncbi:conserved hypothetical protein [Hyphomicrobiales bacterium]|nr:conserved hypothetical protein [Hyphomicrobiales bacterium]
MSDALNRPHVSPTLAARQQLRDGGLPARTIETPAPEQQHRGALGLLRWLAGPRTRPVNYIEASPLDEHTLNDLGLSRVETLYCDPK